MPIVHVGPFWQIGFSVLGGLVGSGIGPFADGRLDEPFCLAICAWRVGFGTDVFEAQSFAGSSKGMRLVTGTIVGHDAPDSYIEPVVIFNGVLEKSNGTFLFLIWKNICESDA